MPEHDSVTLPLHPPTVPGSDAPASDADSGFRPHSSVSRLEPGAEAALCRSESAQPFFPSEPLSLEETGLRDVELEGLVLKYLAASGTACGRQIADQVKLPFAVVKTSLHALKMEMLVAYKGEARMSDYEYELTRTGFERAQRHLERSTYFGAAPVPLDQYNDAIRKQSLRAARPSMEGMCGAFHDLLLPTHVISQIGQALTSGRALFLYGPPGNGKTSIAERSIRGITSPIWIPRTISITGEIIRLYDPSCHTEVPMDAGSSPLLEGYDRRWIRIQRPTIVVGGELTLEQLDFTLSASTGVNESPLQLKSNGGALVIDDFGRQRCSVEALLNRWIIPLEKQRDYLTTASGRQVQVPFEQFLIFATNLQPASLVDEAFLRRIPYKIEVCDPTPDQLKQIFRQLAPKYGFDYSEEMVSYLIQRHFLEAKRPLRYCLARDVLELCQNLCAFHEEPFVLTRNMMDFAVANYFAGL